MSGLQLRPEEWEALAVRWPRLPEEEQASLREQMTRPQERRFDRQLERMYEGKRNFASKLATREDVVQILAMYIDRNILPLAMRMDALEEALAYMRLPWWRRARLTVLGWLVKAWDAFERLLAWFGITLVQLENDDEDADAVHDADDGAPGEEPRAAGDLHEQGRERPADAGPQGRADGDRPEGLIRVVNR